MQTISRRAGAHRLLVEVGGALSGMAGYEWVWVCMRGYVWVCVGLAGYALLCLGMAGYGRVPGPPNGGD